MSKLKVSEVTSDKWLNSDGTENFKCRAWISMNGSGTIAILGSGNISSLVDNGTGDYTLNFIKAMPTQNYSATIGASDTIKGGAVGKIVSSGASTAVPALKTTTQLRVGFGSGSASYDTAEFDVQVVC